MLQSLGIFCCIRHIGPVHGLMGTQHSSMAIVMVGGRIASCLTIENWPFYICPPIHGPIQMCPSCDCCCWQSELTRTQPPTPSVCYAGGCRSIRASIINFSNGTCPEGSRLWILIGIKCNIMETCQLFMSTSPDLHASRHSVFVLYYFYILTPPHTRNMIIIINTHRGDKTKSFSVVLIISKLAPGIHSIN